MTTPRILIVAGSDSGGGAGIQADIKTVTMLGGHAMTAITAVTAQNTLGVQGVHPVPADIVVQQMRSCLDDIGADAVKIGMIGSAATAHAVADVLAALDVPIVFDPVMVATSGDALADTDTIAAFDRLMRLATVATPNTPELATLSGCEVLDEVSQQIAVAALRQRTGCRAILAKGGHLIWSGYTYGANAQGEPCRYNNDTQVFDVLFGDEVGEVVWNYRRIDTRSTHGTGCTLASAIATGVGARMELSAAIGRAIAFVRASLERAPGLGQGHGPMGQQSATEFRTSDGR